MVCCLAGSGPAWWDANRAGWWSRWGSNPRPLECDYEGRTFTELSGGCSELPNMLISLGNSKPIDHWYGREIS
jgi:hypothetical protein